MLFYAHSCITVALVCIKSALVQACTTQISKGQIINIIFPGATKIYLISMWRFHCSMEEILERQLLIRGRAFATFSTIKKALAGRMLCRAALVVVLLWVAVVGFGTKMVENQLPFRQFCILKHTLENSY